MKNSCVCNESYEGVIASVGEDAIKNHYTLLLKHYDEFIENFNYAEVVRLDRMILAAALMDYYSDVKRITDFHKIDAINNPKCIAYEVHWLLKRKPLQIIASDSENSMYVNEQFCALRVLSYTSTSIPIADDEYNSTDLSFFFDSLLYYLKFRNANPQGLELALIFFEAAKIMQKKLYQAK